MIFSEERLAEAVNQPPVVFMDCTAPQIGLAGTITVPIGMIVGIFLGIVSGLIAIGFALGFMFALALWWAALYFIQVNKEKFYESWLDEQLFLKKLSFQSSMGFGGSRLIRESKRYGRGARG